MNGVGSVCKQGGMGLPFGFSGNVDFIDPSAAQDTGGTLKSPWGALRGPSSNALHKMLAELSSSSSSSSSEQQVHVLPSWNCAPSLQPSSFPRFSDPTTFSAPTWRQPLRGGTTTPVESYNCSISSISSEFSDSDRRYSQHNILNARSLVLDSARGELVNASKMTPKEILEAKALAASKSHSEAERRRRERINTHLATLRTLLPSPTKTDKASLLAEVIDQVKMLKRQFSDIYEYSSMPTDHDELSVEREPASAEGKIMIKATLCCDDRHDLMTDLRHALDKLNLQTVKAEMSTLGGRIKNVFIMTLKEKAIEQGQDISVKCVQEALRVVMERHGGGELSPPPGSSTKRQRVASFEAPGYSS